MLSMRKPKNILKFNSPASLHGAKWREAIVSGNGLVGISVLGNVTEDRLQINHGGLLWQGQLGVLPDVSEKLEQTRKLLTENKPRLAQDILPNAFVAKNYRATPAYPLPLCDFLISMPTEKLPKEYLRAVNMENGELSVVYKDGSTKFDRSVFVSRADDLICLEINKTGNKTIDVTFGFDLHDKTYAKTPITFSKVPDGVFQKAEGNYLFFSARNENGSDYGGVAKVTYYGGVSEVKDNKIRIKGANNALVIIKLFVEGSKEKNWKLLKDELSKNKLAYDKMLKTHSSLHSKLYGEVEIDLFGSDRDLFIEELVAKSEKEDLNFTLLEKLWAFGRYMFICSTKDSTGTLLNPYGLWCGDYKAEKAQAFTDGNLNALYSHALGGNLLENVLPFFNFFDNHIDDYKKNAIRLFNAKGIYVPTVSLSGSGLIGSIKAQALHFTGGGAYVASMFYNYYLFSTDIKFLKERALPFMKEVALFYEEFLIIENGLYKSMPSYSPCTTPGNYISDEEKDSLDIAVNSTIDFALLKELLTNLIEGSMLIGANKIEIEKWKIMLERIPKYLVNSENLISEYITDKFTDNYSSSSISQLYPVYPGEEYDIIPAELQKTFAKTATRKFSANQDFTSYNLGMLANIFANSNLGTSAIDCLDVITKMFMMKNLITSETEIKGLGYGKTDSWSTPQIQANMLITALVQNLVVKSNRTSIYLLKSFPRGVVKGDCSGILTKCGVMVNVEWDFKKNSIYLELKAKKATKINLYLPDDIKKYKGNYEFDIENSMFKDIELPANKKIAFDFKF